MFILQNKIFFFDNFLVKASPSTEKKTVSKKRNPYRNTPPPSIVLLSACGASDAHRGKGRSGRNTYTFYGFSRVTSSKIPPKKNELGAKHSNRAKSQPPPKVGPTTF